MSCRLKREEPEGASNLAYDIAKEGGKHSGFFKQYVGKSNTEIHKGIQSIEKQIAEHQAKIANPEKYIPNFGQLDPRQQEALVNKKWPGDIQRLMEQKQILEGILKGDNSMEEVLKDYLADLISLIRDKYKETLAEASGESDSEKSFRLGANMAYYDVLDMIESQLQSFGIDRTQFGAIAPVIGEQLNE